MFSRAPSAALPRASRRCAGSIQFDAMRLRDPVVTVMRWSLGIARWSVHGVEMASIVVFRGMKIGVEAVESGLDLIEGLESERQRLHRFRRGTGDVMPSGQVRDLLLRMTADSLEASGLADRELMLVRFAALVAVDAPQASYLMHFAVATDAGLDETAARDVLAAVAPIVGTPCIVSAADKIARALGLALDIAERLEASEK
jgi:hypothetical protein